MKKVKTKGFITVVLILLVVGLGYYTHLINKTRRQKNTTTKTEVEQLLEYDFEDNYPKTVRETVKLHCKYLKNAYGLKFDEEQLPTANSNMRNLYDEELLAYNSEGQQFEELKKEISLYNDKKQKFISYSLEEASQIEYNTEDGKDYAKTTVTLNITVGTAPIYVEQEYLLRKDESGRWKILGWQALKSDADKNEGNVE